MIERALMVGSAVGVMCPNMLGCEALDEGGAFFQLLLVKMTGGVEGKRGGEWKNYMCDRGPKSHWVDQSAWYFQIYVLMS